MKMSGAGLRCAFTYERHGQVLALVDTGHETRMSVTNDAHAVVEWLRESGELSPGDRVVYCDSDGRWDELEVDKLRFSGFRFVGAADLDSALFTLGLSRVRSPRCE